MFRFLAKSALATFIYKRYRHTIVASLLLLFSYWVIAMIHSDYVDYATSADAREHLLLSYVLKWACLLSATLAYFFFINRRLHAPAGDDVPPPVTPAEGKKASTSATNEAADPFAGIRNKEKLKSRADIALDQNRK